jgi:hypothetical protein
VWSGLRCVDDHDRALLVRPRCEPLGRIHGSERVRDEVVRDDLHAPGRRDLIERVEVELTSCVGLDDAEVRARALRDELPRHEVRVMVELADDDDVPGPEVVEAPRVRDEVDPLGRAAREDDLPRGRSVHEPGDRLARFLVRGRRAFRQLVDAAMHVRVLVLVEAAQPVEHLARLLGARGRVEERDRLSVDQLVEDRKVRAQAVRVELRLCGDGHAAIVPVP